MRARARACVCMSSPSRSGTATSSESALRPTTVIKLTLLVPAPYMGLQLSSPALAHDLCTCERAHACVHVSTCLCACARGCESARVRMRARVHGCMCAGVCGCAYVRLPVCVYARMRVCAYVHMHVCAYGCEGLRILSVHGLELSEAWYATDVYVTAVPLELNDGHDVFCSRGS